MAIMQTAENTRAATVTYPEAHGLSGAATAGAVR